MKTLTPEGILRHPTSDELIEELSHWLIVDDPDDPEHIILIRKQD